MANYGNPVAVTMPYAGAYTWTHSNQTEKGQVNWAKCSLNSKAERFAQLNATQRAQKPKPKTQISPPPPPAGHLFWHRFYVTCPQHHPGLAPSQLARRLSRPTQDPFCTRAPGPTPTPLPHPCTPRTLAKKIFLPFESFLLHQLIAQCLPTFKPPTGD